MNFKKQHIFFIISSLILLHVVMFSIMPLPDPSEARYASISKYMADSGNYIMPMIWIKGELIPFMSKPPLAFWAAAGSIELFGANEFAVRLPSFIAGLLMLVVMFIVLKRYKGSYHAVTATLISATTGGLYLLSGAVLVDIWLCLFSIGAIFLYYAFMEETDIRKKKLISILIFIFLGLGFLTKGPVCLVFFGLPVLCRTILNKRFDSLKYHSWFIGFPLFVIITFPWFILAEKHTPGFLNYFFVNENLMRFLSPDKTRDLYSQVSHSVPKGTAILYTLLVCLPWTVILLGYYSWKKRKIIAVFYALKTSLKKLKLSAFKKSNGDFELFVTGVVVISLFWSISSHIMPYYMVLVTPLFGVWAAEVFRKNHLSSFKIIIISIILLVLYLIAYIPGIYFVSQKKSTKYITNKAVELYKKHKFSGKIVFVRRVKYSTHFYGGNLILPHKKEKVEGSFIKHPGSDREKNLFVLKKKYLKRMSNDLKTKADILFKDKNWVILQLK